MLSRLLKTRLAPYKKLLALLVVLQIVQSCAVLWLPTLNAAVIDDGVVAGDQGRVLSLGALMVAATLVQIASSIGAVHYGARTAAGLGRDLRAALFDRVQSFSARETRQFGTASLVTRTLSDVQQIQMLVLSSFTLVISAPLTCVGGIVMALSLDAGLSSVLVAVVPVLAVSVGAVVRRLTPLFRGMQERLDTVNRVLREQITGVRVIRAFVKDDYERARFRRTNASLMDVSLRAGLLGALMFPLVMTMVNVSSVVVVWAGAHRIADGALGVGALTAFLTYLQQIVTAVMMAMSLFVMAPRAAVCAERVQEVLDTQGSVPAPSRPIGRTHRHGILEIRAAFFQHPGAEEPVLRGIELTAGPGETTAVIGSTGSGKSTLLQLVPRLFDVTDGQVLVNGVDVRSLDPALLAQTVGLVPQHPHLFSGTVATNLRFGAPGATDEELWHALRVAQAHDFVEHLGGLDTPVTQGGTNLSGGQRQRLAIARVLVQRPQIYLFDDTFSALDQVTAAALRTALAEETSEAAVVMVAQRVSTVRDADRIVVLDRGRVVGTGTHHELMESDDTYREIVSSQSAEAEAA
ncbi:ABC transporter ATP-binding protein [Streptomyces wuyuanensis]|uniref:ABC transporter ATP-binding protein n=1 Tax=Streptomyces wuyuanensis TaxID=1196353 RepID=UPI003713F08E